MAENSADPTQNPDLPASFPWLQRLVRLPSVTEESNLELIQVIEQEFSRHGIATHRTVSEDGQRANLFATVPAADGSTDGGVVLSGHTDVVAVAEQPWDTDPFEPVVRDGKVYGRGVADMKGFLAGILWLLPRIADARLEEPLHFAFSYDEEIGCVGAPRMIEEFTARGIRPDFCIVGEPSRMHVIQAHKAAQHGRVTFRGVPKHSSMATHGLNAVHWAGEFIRFYSRLADSWEQEGPYDPGFAIPHTTGGVNFIRGGLAYNVVAEQCVLEYDFRAVPATPHQELTEHIRSYLKQTLEPQMLREARRLADKEGADAAALENVGIDLEILADVPALDAPDDDPAIALGTALGAGFGGENAPTRVPYGTEGGQFQAVGIDTIVCGPGDIAQAHTANEWVELEQLRACEDFLERVLERAEGRA